MKKAYQTPKAEVISLYAEAPIMAGSIDMGLNEDVDTGASDAYSQKSGWSADNWSE